MRNTEEREGISCPWNIGYVLKVETGRKRPQTEEKIIR